MKTKRFKSRQEIMDFVFKWNARRNELLREADGLDRQADEYFKYSDTADLARELRATAYRRRKLAFRYESVKIPRLKRTLAAWDTPFLPGIEPEPTLLLQQA